MNEQVLSDVGNLGSGWEPEQNFFSTIHVDVTHRCNMACANCYIPNRTIPDMDKDRLFDLVRRLPSKVTLRLIGGEPTLRSDIDEIIRTLTDLGHTVHLVTNGLKISDRTYLASLKNAGLCYLYISMNGADNDEIYQKMDSGRFAAQKVLALENALSLRLMLSTGTILARGVNESSVESQLRLIIDTTKRVSPSRKFGMSRMPEVRFRNVGQVGRYIKDSSLSYEEMSVLVLGAARKLGRVRELVPTSPKMKPDGFVLDSEVGAILVRYTDWKAEADFLANENSRRGRVTQSYKLYYAAEDVRRNENGY
jgi:organic radical activating enzyme